MLVPPDRVTALRLILQQPSTVWANFGVDNVTITEYNEEVTMGNWHILLAREYPICLNNRLWMKRGVE